MLSSLAGNALAQLLTAEVNPQQMKLLSALDSKLDFIDLQNLDLSNLKTQLSFDNGLVTVKPFDFNNHYVPSKGIEKFLTGTPSIISMKQLETSLKIFCQINLEKLRKKSLKQTSIMTDLILRYKNINKIQIISPSNILRGGHIAMKHKNASKLLEIYEKNGLIGDFRPPNIIRFGISPLYNSYKDIWNASKIINNLKIFIIFHIFILVI